MILFNYRDLVKRKSRVTILVPGLYDTQGGNLMYCINWAYEASKYTDFVSYSVPQNIVKFTNNYETVIINDMTNRKLISYIIGLFKVIFPLEIISKAFVPYRKIQGDVDLIHIPLYFIHNDILIFYLLKKYPEVKLMYTLHDPTPHLEKKGKWFVRVIADRSNKRVIKLAQKNKKRLFIHIHSKLIVPEYLKNTCSVVVHQHPLPAINNSIKTIKRRGNSIRIGFLGQIHEYKGIDILFNAFKLLEENIEHDMLDKVEIVVAGSGSLDKDKWEALRFRITLKNYFLKDEEFISIMNSCDCIVLPYIEATQSGVAAMANSLNKPIICTDTGALKEMVEASSNPNSRLIQANNPHALYEAILQFVSTHGIED